MLMRARRSGATRGEEDATSQSVSRDSESEMPRAGGVGDTGPALSQESSGQTVDRQTGAAKTPALACDRAKVDLAQLTAALATMSRYERTKVLAGIRQDPLP